MLAFINGTCQWLNASQQPQFITDKTEYDGTAKCFLDVLSEDQKGRYDDGRYKNCTYSVRLNMRDVPADWNPALVKVTNNHKGEIGPLQVQRIEFYDVTQSVMLWV